VEVPRSLPFAARDETFSHGCTTDSSLAAFLGRPIRIDSRAWTVTGSLNYTLDPWVLFLTNPNVVGRLNNYTLLRGDLRVKFLINGNPFYFGRAVCAYRPLDNHDEILTNSSSSNNDDIYLMALSQLPGIELDSCSSQGGVINCDYLYQKNFMSLPGQDYTELGVITVKSYQALKHANGGTDPITISAFAWMENVDLHVPTTNAYQSGSLSDGPISKAASSVAKYTDILSAVPMIGPYAKATSEMASNVGKFARAFGFSRPNRQGVNIGVVQRSAGTLANVNLDENVAKLSLDAEQELTVDPRTCGLSAMDEMSFQHILTKESYLTQFAWTTTDNPDSFLFNAQITPALASVGTTLVYSNPIVGTTPMGHLAALFRYWSGSVKFRFVVVASDYHKGRLRVTLDPRFNDTLGGTDWNTVYTRVIDISKEREFEITANWMQPTSFAEIQTIGASSHSDTIRYTGYDVETNGVLTVEVLNDLSTPNVASSSISVMVYVRAGDDMRYMSPVDSLGDLTYINGDYQAGVLNVDDEESKVVDEVAGAISVPVQDHLAELYGGENIVSVRALLKRYWFTRWEMRDTIGVNSYTHQSWDFPDYPVTRGFAANGLDLTGGAVSYNYSRLTALTYLAPCYAVRRGSIRYKYILSSSIPGNSRKPAWVSRGNGTYNALTRFASTPYADPSPSVATSVGYDLTATGGGAAAVATSTNPVLEVDLPFYSKFRFAFARKFNNNNGYGADDTNRMHHVVEVVGSASSSEVSGLHQFVATGEDFMLSMYLHSPAVIIGANPAP